VLVEILPCKEDDAFQA
jgi:hypothetical protein